MSLFLSDVVESVAVMYGVGDSYLGKSLKGGLGSRLFLMM